MINNVLMDRVGQLSDGKDRHKKKMSKEPIDIYITNITLYITYITLYITLYITFLTNTVPFVVRHAA